VIENSDIKTVESCQLADIPSFTEKIDHDEVTKADLVSLFRFCKESSSMPGTDLPENPIYSALETLLSTLLNFLVRKQVSKTCCMMILHYRHT
jgi:hypothetical protein